MKPPIFSTVGKLVIEAAAIAAYESFIRYKQDIYRGHIKYHDWIGLPKEDKDHWRDKIIEAVQQQ